VGQEFSKAYYILVCGTLVQPVLLTEQIANDLVYVENKVRYTGSAIFITSLVGLALATIGGKFYGAVGAGIGSEVGLILYTIWLNYFYKNNLCINISRFFKECHGRIVPLLFVYAVVSYFVVLWIGVNSWPQFLLAIIVYTLLFSLIVYIFLFNKEERQIIINIIKRK